MVFGRQAVQASSHIFMLTKNIRSIKQGILAPPRIIKQ